jgi:uncharacterized protein involved in outer membrane biogenesis
MGRLLTLLGLVIVAVFVAAAAAPLVVDWTAQKGLIEREAARRLGVPVVIDGRMDVRLLPTPQLALERVRLGRTGAEARIDAVRLDMSLPALLRGEAHVTAAQLVQPKVWLALDAQGRLVGEGVSADLSAARVDRFEVEGGELTIEDPRERTRFFVDQMAFSGEAQSLAGPLRMEGGARFEGRAIGFVLATGRAEGGSLRGRLQITPVDAPVAADFDGQASLAEGRPLFTGTARLRGVGAADATTRDSGWRLEAAIEARPGRVHAREVRIIPLVEDRMIQFAGAMNLALGAQPRLDAALSVRQIDLDRLVEQGIESPSDVASILQRVLALPALSAAAAVPTDLTLDIGSAVIAGGLVQELRLRTDTRDGRWRLGALEARLPGNTSFKLGGVAALRGGPLFFDGEIEATIRSPTVFAGWLEGELLRPRPARPPSPVAPLSVTARLTVGPNRTGFERLTARVGQAALQGSVEHLAEEGLLRASLTAGEIDLEPVVALVTALSPRAGTFRVRRVELEARAGRVTHRQLELRDLDVALSAGADTIEARRFRGEANGLRVSGSGRAGGDGGSVALDVSGERIGPAVEALDSALGGNPVLRGLATRSRAIGAVALRLDLARRDGRFELGLAGTAGGSQVQGRLALDSLDSSAGALSRLALTLTNPRPDILLDQLGIEPTPGGALGPGRVELTAERVEDDRHRIALAADLAGARLAADGDVLLASRRPGEGGVQLRLDAADVGPLLALMGAPLVEPGERVPVALRAVAQRAEDDRLILDRIEGRANGQPVAGRLALAATPAPAVEGLLRVGAVSLERVVGLLVGPWPEAETGWSGRAFAPRPLPAATASIRVAAAELWLGEAKADEAAFVLRLDGSTLALDGLAARLAGGRLSGELAATRSDAGVRLGGRLALEAARFDELVWQRAGRPVATGRLELRLAFDGAGRSPSALVTTLSGEGTLTIADGELRGVAASGFSAGLRAAEAGAEISEARLAELVRQELDAGALPFERIEAALTLQGGVVRAANVRLDGGPTSATVRGAIDLGRWALDGELTLEADGARAGQRGPRITLAYAGPLEEPERRIDVRAFVDFLNLRRFEREVERLERLQREAEERERLMRQLEEQERARRARLTPPPADAPSAPAPPPAPPTGEPAQARPQPVAPAEERGADRERFDRFIREALREPAEPPRPALTPLPPPVVVAPAPPVRPAPRGPLPLIPR